MKFVTLSIMSLILATFADRATAEQVQNLRFGDTEVSVNFEINKTGSTIFTMIAQIAETNDRLRGLKNTDPRRLSKLGQLVYQCKLLILPSSRDGQIDTDSPALTARGFSLYTGVDLPLDPEQRIGIQARALQTPGETSLFNVALDKIETVQTRREIIGEGTALNLKQFDLGSFIESELFESSESVQISARFPIFQMERPVNEWHYHFDLVEFKQAVKYIDENCTTRGFRTLTGKAS